MYVKGIKKKNLVQVSIKALCAPQMKSLAFKINVQNVQKCDGNFLPTKLIYHILKINERKKKKRRATQV